MKLFTPARRLLANVELWIQPIEEAYTQRTGTFQNDEYLTDVINKIYTTQITDWTHILDNSTLRTQSNTFTHGSVTVNQYKVGGELSLFPLIHSIETPTGYTLGEGAKSAFDFLYSNQKNRSIFE